MKSHHVTLAEPVSAMIETQIACGRFKDFSAAIQEAAWNYFFGTASPYQEYGVTPEEVERAYEKCSAETARLRRAGKLKEWRTRLGPSFCPS
ncbi:MAG: hypothetical protein FJ403_04665 [Verrucomicrobia bacterium]|nr:hypothetical protein [Verrucomicrobiota bacterium]